jgi:hypothetical protein
MNYKCYIPVDYVFGFTISDSAGDEIGWSIDENITYWLVKNKIKYVLSFDNISDDHVVSLDFWLCSGHTYVYDCYKPYIDFENANDAMMFRLKFGGGTDALSFHEEE